MICYTVGTGSLRHNVVENDIFETAVSVRSLYNLSFAVILMSQRRQLYKDSVPYMSNAQRLGHKSSNNSSLNIISWYVSK